MKPRHSAALPVLSLLSALALAAPALSQDQTPFQLTLGPASATIQNCLPDARATVTVVPREETVGVDTLDLQARGLVPNTGFAVFLTELPGAPFGAVQYIADFTTNGAGIGSVRVDTVVLDAFASFPVNGTRVRKELDNIVVWFADAGNHGPCAGGSAVFDGDGVSGIAALSSSAQ